MRIPKILASWIEPPPPNTRSSYGREESRYLGRHALGRVLHDEMAGVVEHHELGVGDLLGKAMGRRHRRVVVPGAPQDQRGHPQLRELALVGRELLEVAGLVEREPRAAARRRREALVVLV